MANLLSILVTFLTSGTFRRAAAFLGSSAAAVAAPWIAAKLGLQIDPAVLSTEIAGLIVGGGVYIVQSMSNEKHAATLAAAAEAQVITVPDAIKVLTDAGHVVVPPGGVAPAPLDVPAAVAVLNGLPGNLPAPKVP